MGKGTESIDVDNQTYDKSYIIKNVVDTDNNPVTSFIDLYKLLEAILVDIIDNLFRLSLREMSAYKYVNVGGKSINLFIGEKYLKKSFDFDLHIYDGNQQDINQFGIKIFQVLNNTIKTYPLYRLYIINILKRYGFITTAEENHYKTKQLFYYGNRHKGASTIAGIFFHFIFRNDLINGNKKYSNARPPNNLNEVYYPISDIDLEHVLNFGLPIVDDRFFFNGYDGVRYSNYIVTLHNLIQYTTFGGWKAEKNFNKLSQFKYIDRYTCHSLQKYTDQFLTDLNNLDIKTTIDSIPAQNLIINGNEVFVLNRSTKSIINDFITEYMNKRAEYYDVCMKNLILDRTVANKNLIFNNNVSVEQKKNFFTAVERKVYEFDTDRYVLYYTENGYEPIGTLNDYNHFGLDGSIQFTDLTYADEKIRFSDGSTVTINKREKINTKQLLNNVIDSIDDTITKIRNDPVYNSALKVLKDEFIVYRMQNFMCINSPTGDQFNVSIIKPNNILYMPRFLSTSFTTNYNYFSFLKTNTFLFRIRIKKSSKRWIVLNRYSEHPNEAEILLNRNCFFVVLEKNDYPLNLGGQLRDITVIDLLLCDDMVEAMAAVDNPTIKILNMNDEDYEKTQSNVVQLSKSGKTTPTYFDQPTKYQNLPPRPPPSAPAILINQNVLFFNNEDRDNADLLVSDVQKYHNLLQSIMKSDSVAKSTMMKTSNTIFAINKTVDLPKPTVSDIIVMPRAVAASAAGGSYYDKYIKYKNKYLMLKKN